MVNASLHKVVIENSDRVKFPIKKFQRTNFKKAKIKFFQRPRVANDKNNFEKFL